MYIGRNGVIQEVELPKSQGRSAEAGVEGGSAGCHQLLLTLASLLACHLVRPHVVEEALG